MEYFGFLPKPVKIKDDQLHEIIFNEHELFNDSFIIKKNRPKLFDKFIYVDVKRVDGINERFLHCTSFGNTEKYKMYPCTNDLYSYPCSTICNYNNSIKTYKKIKRTNCNYRLSRVRWIVPIIEQAGNNKNIVTWSKQQKDKTNSEWFPMRYVRYQEGLVDFVVIFKEVYKKDGNNNLELNMFNFRTAFPVFNKYDKFTFDKDYHHYKEIKKPAFP